MKPFLIASLTFVSLTAGVSAAEEAYYYDGVPYWGPDVYYTRKKVIVKDVDKHVNVNRNIYYGGHHFARDWHGSHAVAHTALHRDRR